MSSSPGISSISHRRTNPARTSARSSRPRTPSAMAFASPTTLSDAIAERFRSLRTRGRRALVCYVTAGHPDYERSLVLLRGIVEAGADIVEVGVPFSDPLADGPVIQASSQQALEGGMTLARTFGLIREAGL